MIASAFSLSHVDWFVNVEDANHVWPTINWDSPTLVVHDVTKAIHFYERVFGFLPVFILPDEHNEVTFARMRYRGTYFTLTRDSDPMLDERCIPASGVCAAFYLYIDDVRQTVGIAEVNGSHVLEQPHLDSLGYEKARILDIFGYIWDIVAKI